VVEALLLVGTFVGALASGLTGFAFTLVAYGFWLHVLPPREAVPLSLLLGIVSQAYTTWRLRRGIRLDLLWPFLLGGIIGVPFGPALLRIIEPGQFRVAIGLFLVVYSAFMLFRPPLRPVTGGGRPADGAVGIVGGVLASAAGLTGAVPTLWCGLRGWPKDIQRGVYQPFVLVIHSLAIVALGTGIAFDGTVLRHTALAFPVMIVGTLIGLRFYGKLDEMQFRRIVLWMLLVSGVLLVGASL
jgi:uncharacterized protein